MTLEHVSVHSNIIRSIRLMPSHRSVLDAIARRAMVEHGLEPDFPPDAVAEAARLGEAPIEAVRDLRQLPWSSIDNAESRDLDQLEVCGDSRDGLDRLLVAIADVDALVPRDSALDDHARRNTTSVYTAARVFPMLPESLSTDRTSLNPDEDRVRDRRRDGHRSRRRGPAMRHLPGRRAESRQARLRGGGRMARRNGAATGGARSIQRAGWRRFAARIESRSVCGSAASRKAPWTSIAPKLDR